MNRRGLLTALACARHGYPSGAIRRARRGSQAAPLKSPAGCGSPFELASPPLHACARKGAKGSVGCRDMRMLRRSYQCIACGSRKIGGSTGDPLRLTRCREGSCARTGLPFALSPEFELALKRVPACKQEDAQNVRMRGCSIGRGGKGAHHDYQEVLRGRG